MGTARSFRLTYSLCRPRCGFEQRAAHRPSAVAVYASCPESAAACGRGAGIAASPRPACAQRARAVQGRCCHTGPCRNPPRARAPRRALSTTHTHTLLRLHAACAAARRLDAHQEGEGDSGLAQSDPARLRWAPCTMCAAAAALAMAGSAEPCADPAPCAPCSATHCLPTRPCAAPRDRVPPTRTFPTRRTLVRACSLSRRLDGAAALTPARLRQAPPLRI